MHDLGFGLKIFDTYRPQRAVNYFQEWALDAKDTLNRSIFYPHHNKPDLFRLGYISRKSGHSRGSTIDVTIYDLETGLDREHFPAAE